MALIRACVADCCRYNVQTSPNMLPMAPWTLWFQDFRWFSLLEPDPDSTRGQDRLELPPQNSNKRTQVHSSTPKYSWNQNESLASYWKPRILLKAFKRNQGSSRGLFCSYLGVLFQSAVKSASVRKQMKVAGWCSSPGGFALPSPHTEILRACALTSSSFTLPRPVLNHR